MSRVEPNRNVYIGHRYVPLVVGEWDKSIQYEGLSIVTFKGASYTSKKRVPVGIDIENEEYWVLTGNYNAQIEYYREETNRVADDLEQAKNDLNQRIDDTVENVDTKVENLTIYVNNEVRETKEYLDRELLEMNGYVDDELGKNRVYFDDELGKHREYVDDEISLTVKKDELVFNAHDFGAKGDGVTNDSNAIINAVNNIERGTVLFPPGIYIVESLPIKNGVNYEGYGTGITEFKSPATPKDHMLIYEGSVDLVSGSIKNIELSGFDGEGRISRFNGIDISNASRGERFSLTGLTIRGFDKGYNGTNNDRWIYIVDSHINNNNIGIYCGEHPILNNVDFRYNDVGMTGRLNDLTAINCRFNYNRVGVEYDKELENGYVSNSIFQNCGFFRNEEIGIVLTDNNIVTNSRPSGNSNNDTCIIIEGRRNQIKDNTFSQNYTTGFENGAINIKNNDNVISDNLFNLAGGKGIVYDDVSAPIFNIIKDNTIVDTNGFNMYPFIEVDGNIAFYLNVIENNDFYITKIVDTPIIKISNSIYGGNSIKNNNFYVGGSAEVSLLLDINLFDSVFKDNFLYKSTNGTLVKDIEASISQTTIVKDNKGFSLSPTNKSKGEITIPDGENSVVGEHYLNYQPDISSLLLTPRNNLNGDNYWIESVTRTQFTISRSGNEGNMTFNWRIEE